MQKPQSEASGKEGAYDLSWAPPIPPSNPFVSGSAKPIQVLYWRDISDSCLASPDVESLYWEEVGENFQEMIQRFPAGSLLEVYVTGKQPGIPKCLFSYEVPASRSERRKAAEMVKEKIINLGMPETTHHSNVASWIVEDAHALALRSMTLGGNGSIVLATDAEQNSTLVSEQQIPAARDLTPLVSRVLAKCPPLDHPPAKLVVLQLKHTDANGHDYSADALKYVRFIELCSEGWGVRDFVRSEPRKVGKGF